MATAKIADIIVDTLASVGVKRVYGVPGDSLNGITDAIRTHKSVAWVHMRNEEAAAFAAGAEAHLTGNLAVCAGSCGPGNTHLINGLYDCQRNRVPVLAIAAQIPSKEIGSEYFQETKPDHIFKDCSHLLRIHFASEPDAEGAGDRHQDCDCQARRVRDRNLRRHGSAGSNAAAHQPDAGFHAADKQPGTCPAGARRRAC